MCAEVRTDFESWFSTSTMWFLGIKLGSSDLTASTYTH